MLCRSCKERRSSLSIYIFQEQKSQMQSNPYVDLYAVLVIDLRTKRTNRREEGKRKTIHAV